MKRIILTISIALLSLGSFSVSAAEKQTKAEESHLQNHFKLYGFIRNFFIYDSRESVSGTGDLFYYLPKDVSLVNKGTAEEFDQNAQSSLRYLSLTSRLGVDVTGYHIGNVHFGAKIEGDFYAGLASASGADAGKYFPANSKIGGTATARLRQAYATVTWKNLPMGMNGKASVGLKMGQAWHPMAADMPHIFSLEAGAPFGPFSRTPQITMDANLGENWIVSAAAIFQMQYNSAGPVGASPIYMKYGKTPEFYAAVAYKSKGFLFRVGADLLSIKPRVFGQGAQGHKVEVADRKTSLLYYAYAQYSYKNFAVKAKTTFGEGGEHMNLMSGYAKVGENSDGSWDYASLRNSSSWLSMSYGKKWQGVLFLGYVKNLGLADPVSFGETGMKNIPKSDVYFCGNGFSNINQIYRINPQLIYNIGKMNIGLEYQFTGVQYGDYYMTNNMPGSSDMTPHLNAYGLADQNLHWVGNHRINLMVKYNF